MDSLPTDQLVAQVRRSGWQVSRASLQADVQRGLISPLMPSTETPGRGVPARWNPMSVRRARRIARLRARGVNGHVLPLLLFLADGWGWDHIRPAVQDAARKAWQLDRAHLSKPARVRTPDDLIDNADAEAWIGDPHQDEILGLRRWLFGQQWYGDTLEHADPVPMLLLSLLSGSAPAAQRAEAEGVARSAVEEREALALPAQAVADWLGALDAEAVAQGRQGFWTMVRWMRIQKHREDATACTNPLTLGGQSPKELAAYFRRNPGRLTLAQVLGACIAQAMLMARIAKGMGSRPDSG